MAVFTHARSVLCCSHDASLTERWPRSVPWFADLHVNNWGVRSHFERSGFASAVSVVYCLHAWVCVRVGFVGNQIEPMSCSPIAYSRLVNRQTKHTRAKHSMCACQCAVFSVCSTSTSGLIVYHKLVTLSVLTLCSQLLEESSLSGRGKSLGFHVNQQGCAH